MDMPVPDASVLGRKGRIIDRLRAVGFHAFLIGEELMRSSDEGAALQALLT